MQPPKAMIATWMLLVMISLDTVGEKLRSKPKFESCKLFLISSGIMALDSSA